jgi:hypothetical protein
MTLPGLVNGTAYSVKVNGSDYQEVTATTSVAPGMGSGFPGGFPGGQDGRRGDQNGEPPPDWNGERPERDDEAPPDGQPGGGFGRRGENGGAPAPN